MQRLRQHDDITYEIWNPNASEVAIRSKMWSTLCSQRNNFDFFCVKFLPFFCSKLCRSFLRELDVLLALTRCTMAVSNEVKWSFLLHVCGCKTAQTTTDYTNRFKGCRFVSWCTVRHWGYMLWLVLLNSLKYFHSINFLGFSWNYMLIHL